MLRLCDLQGGGTRRSRTGRLPALYRRWPRKCEALQFEEEGGHLLCQVGHSLFFSVDLGSPFSESLLLLNFILVLLHFRRLHSDVLCFVSLGLSDSCTEHILVFP